MHDAMLFKKTDNKMVHCFLCAHQCHIQPGNMGVCGVRKNIDGNLFTYSYGKLIAANSDPVEKKPLYHFLPGTKSYSIATIGCNFQCGFCQNWQISQKKADINKSFPGTQRSPEQVVDDAIKNQCRSISFTYTEPTIFFEYAFDIAKIAKQAGLKTIFVSNGYMTAQMIQKIKPYLDACNIDLKSFSDEFYVKNCKAHLEPVLNSIKTLKESGIWLEITTLLITNQNDSEQEIENLSKFIANIDKDIPWHVSRFFPQYKFSDQEPTPIETILKAEGIGKSVGLKYVYPGNIPEEKNTMCTQCKNTLIKRNGYEIELNKIDNGKCPFCGKAIPGIWM